ncbi:MAG: hypothetical protein PVH80_03405 [Anaerolineae bacterium]|jgi:hypothetical protein
MKQGTLAIIALSALLVLWYVALHLYNRRRGRRLRGWALAVLDALGGERDEGWIGSPASGGRINVRRAEPPFRRLEITFLLANREIPLLWLADHLRGKQDRIIMRATLRSPRRGEVMVRSDGRTQRHDEAWKWEAGPHDLRVACRGHGARRLVAALEPWLEAYGPHVSRFDWSKQDPHINLQLRIAGLLPRRAETILADLGAALGANELG